MAGKAKRYIVISESSISPMVLSLKEINEALAESKDFLIGKKIYEVTEHKYLVPLKVQYQAVVVKNGQ